jgi:hypothetical protein
MSVPTIPALNTQRSAVATIVAAAGKALLLSGWIRAFLGEP